MEQNPARALPRYKATAWEGDTAVPGGDLSAEEDGYNRDRETLTAITDPLERARFFMVSRCCPPEHRGDITAIVYWLREHEGWSREEVAAERLAIVGLMRGRDGEEAWARDSFLTTRRA